MLIASEFQGTAFPRVKYSLESSGFRASWIPVWDSETISLIQITRAFVKQMKLSNSRLIWIYLSSPPITRKRGSIGRSKSLAVYFCRRSNYHGLDQLDDHPVWCTFCNGEVNVSANDARASTCNSVTYIDDDSIFSVWNKIPPKEIKWLKWIIHDVINTPCCRTSERYAKVGGSEEY